MKRAQLGAIVVFVTISLVLHIYIVSVRQQEVTQTLKQDYVFNLQTTGHTTISKTTTFPAYVHHHSSVRSVINATNFGRKDFKFVPLTQQDIDGVAMFVIFIGYPRSGHSVIGSVIDGHPNAVMAHEYKLFNKCSKFDPQSTMFKSKANIFNSLYRSSAFSAKGGWRSDSATSKGYNLHMTEWHGNFSTLKVIGDKSGGITAKYFYHNYTLIEICYQQLLDTIQIPLQFIHVVRNPFDMIATAVIRRETGIEDMRKLLFKGQKIEVPLERYEDTTTSIFHFAEAVTRVKNLASVLEIHQEDYIRSPRHHVLMICTALDLPCPEEFIDDCEKKTYREVTRSRDILFWPPAVKQRIEDGLKNYPFFSSYSFEGN